MNITYVEGDLFDSLREPIESEPVVIAHVVNDKGAFGAGFVVPLAQTFPVARQAYLAWAGKENKSPGSVDWHPSFERGQSQLVRVREDPVIYVAHMLAQTLGGKRPLFYNDLARAMDAVVRAMHQVMPQTMFRIICPMFGAGLAGGDWNFVEKLIEDCWVRRNIPVTVYYLPRFLPENWTPPKLECDHPWHRNPALITPCPECGAGWYEQ